MRTKKSKNPLATYRTSFPASGPATSSFKGLHPKSHWQSGESWAVRKGPWKLTGRGRDVQTLVNLEEDIPEDNNLLGNEPARVDALLEVHRQWVQSTGYWWAI